MVDSISKDRRSQIMAKIRSSGTIPEILFRNSNLKLAYQPKLPGKPDFVDFNNREVIFIDGCFWHGCEEHCRMPSSNVLYWKDKIKRNMLRDKEINLAYINSGWKVRRIWEHEVSKNGS